MTDGDFDSWAHLATSREDAVGGLRALADELGYRQGQRYALLADKIERGESVSVHDTSAWAQPRGEEDFAVGVTASLARQTLLLERRQRVRKLALAAVCLAFCYLIASLVVSYLVLYAFGGEVTQLIAHDPQPTNMPTTFAFLFKCGALLCSVLFVILLVRIRFPVPKWIEWMADRVPIVGGLLQLADASAACETIYQSLSLGSDYPSAFGSAGETNRSRILGDWLRNVSTRLSTGASFRQVAEEIASRAGTMAGILSSAIDMKTHQSTVALWREASDQMHDQLARQTIRLTTVFVPMVVVLSVMICGFSLVQLFVTLIQMIDDLMWW